MPTEILPVADIVSEFDSQWNASNVTKPTLITVNAENEPIRFDLNAGDHLVARTGSPAFEETPIGNWKYGNRVYGVEIELFTLEDRQRLYNLMQEVRRITHNRMHSLTNFQRQQFLSFTEETGEQVNMWTGKVQLQIVNNAVLLDT